MSVPVLLQNPPFDLAGGADTDANPFDTSQFSTPSLHEIGAVLEMDNGDIVEVSAFFAVGTLGEVALIATPSSIARLPGTQSITVETCCGSAAQNVGVSVTIPSEDSFWLSATPSSGTTPFTFDILLGDEEDGESSTLTIVPDDQSIDEIQLPVELLAIVADQIHVSWSTYSEEFDYFHNWKRNGLTLFSLRLQPVTLQRP